MAFSWTYYFAAPTSLGFMHIYCVRTEDGRNRVATNINLLHKGEGRMRMPSGSEGKYNLFVHDLFLLPEKQLIQLFSIFSSNYFYVSV